jgi:predicted acylesterase/phospholipase RssA
LNSTPAFSGVFGGGGLFGIGYGMGVVDGLRTRGIDLTTSTMLGTSAGSWVAAATALGVPFSAVAALPVPRFPNPKSGVLAASAEKVFGKSNNTLVHVVACQLPQLRRTQLSGSDFPLSSLVAASSAVPGLLAPQKLGKHFYIDGGVRSGVSVDWAHPSETLIVVAPLAGAMFGPFGSFVERKMKREMKEWKEKYSGRILLFAPKESTSHIATLPQHLFDKEIALAAYEHGLNEATNAIL